MVVFNVTMKRKEYQDPVQYLVLIINSFYQNPVINEKVYIPRVSMSSFFIEEGNNE